jgi:hypothetical protein
MKTIYSAIQPADEASLPFRIILHNMGTEENPNFTTHMEVLERDLTTRKGFNHGNYFQNDLVSAIKDYEARCAKYNLDPRIQEQLWKD